MREEAVRWHDLLGGTYVQREEPEGGVYRSVVFPGLRLDVPALIAGDRRLFETLRAGLESQDHARFVTALEAEG